MRIIIHTMKHNRAKSVGEMYVCRRKESKITEMIKNGKSVRVSELAKQFGVSESTIRRDLTNLETIGMIKRTHGGAVDNFVTSFEPIFC